MSRVGKATIAIPRGVEIKHEKGFVHVKGPKGQLSQRIEPGFELKIEENELNVVRPTEQKRHKALHGLYRALLNNMTQGVSTGFTRTLELIGVGYRADAKGQVLELSVGYSHPVFFGLPPEVTVATEQQKGQPPRIILSSHDKQLLGQIVAKIRKVRPPEPYKGKGIREAGEVVRRKAGKAAAKK
ncbi:MAG: 50S ribosomal protein L6 [Bacteroidetes bacterium]|jgi:large subunit ribosomal protein L6|nr:50S ribosomal protein L6 [Bacteroidota bacterium]